MREGLRGAGTGTGNGGPGGLGGPAAGSGSPGGAVSAQGNIIVLRKGSRRGGLAWRWAGSGALSLS